MLRSPLPFFGGPVVGFEFGILAPLQIKAFQADFGSRFNAPIAGLSLWIKSAIIANHTHFSKSVFIGLFFTSLFLLQGTCGLPKPFLGLVRVAHFMV